MRCALLPIFFFEAAGIVCCELTGVELALKASFKLGFADSFNAFSHAAGVIGP